MMKEIKTIDPTRLELDPLATLTMTYTTEGFIELKRNIEQQGQLLPIILRRGKILDGRHRTQACLELGINVRYEEVGDISDDKALSLVISQSINKAVGSDASKVEAYLLCLAKGVKQKEMPKLFDRLNKNYVDKMSYIEKENPDYLKAILKQKGVRLYNKTFDKIEDYGTIHGIYKTLKGNEKCKDKVIEVSPSSNDSPAYEIDIASQMVSIEAVKEYWELYYLFNITHPSSLAGIKLKDMVNKLYGS